jgi:hypothetical protein
MSIFDKKSGFDPPPGCRRRHSPACETLPSCSTWRTSPTRRPGTPGDCDRPDVDDDINRTFDKRSDLVGLLAGRLLDAKLTESAQRLLLFLMSRLRYSPHPDVVWVSKS